MTGTLGERFARALAAKDYEGMTSLLHPQVDFRGMTPNTFWQATGSREVIEKILPSWFEESDRIDRLLSVENDQVGDRQRVGYRFAVSNADGDFIVDQQAYYESAGGAITWMRVLCSGWRPRHDTGTPAKLSKE
jgi:hypothetical protein